MSAKVLIVDDSGLARRSTRRVLESAGYEVIEADDGLSALERYFVERPAVVLLDLVMKGMYGLEVLTKLREIDPAARVIVISADIQHVVARNELRRRRRRISDQARAAGGDRRCRPARARSVLMELTTVQQDALIELLNIGFGRAAGALSELTGHRVVLEVPEVSIHPIAGLAPALRSVRRGRRRQRASDLFRTRWPATRCSSSTTGAAGMLKELLTDEPALPLASTPRRARC